MADQKKLNIREKKHRLPKEYYRGLHHVAFTLCLKNRATFFIAEERLKPFEEVLIYSARKCQCDVTLYLFMPDHCHIILSGKEEHADPLAAIKQFKQQSSYWLSRHAPNMRWQKDFYDHILRKDEDLGKQVNYILNNPVRKGLVENGKNYPFKGSTVYDFNELEQ